MGLKCFPFHHWSKWEQYDEKVTHTLGRIMPKNVQGKECTSIEKRQKRNCMECNKEQDELVYDY
jgi:hypothetical protein